MQRGLLPSANPTLWEAEGGDADDWAGQGGLSPLVAMEKLLPKLTEAAERFGSDDDGPIFGEAAKQAVRAVGLLTGKYHLIATNVPYLGRGNQDETLRAFCAREYPHAKADLATVFVERCLTFCAPGGSVALVTPQNWLFLGSYAKLRDNLLRTKTWNVVARLGAGAFETIGGEVVNVGLFVLTNAAPGAFFPAVGEVSTDVREVSTDVRKVSTDVGEVSTDVGKVSTDVGEVSTDAGDVSADAPPDKGNAPESFREPAETYRGYFCGLDASAVRTPREKEALLRTAPVRMVAQAAQLQNPDARISLDEGGGGTLLSAYANSVYGLRTADSNRFIHCFWEIPVIAEAWIPHLSTVTDTVDYHGREHVLFWENGKGALRNYANKGLASLQGGDAWGKFGILVTQMRHLPVTLYTGEKYDNNCTPIYPYNPAHLAAIWCFCASPEFNAAVRKIDQALKVMNQTLLKVPFDLERWQGVAREKYPDGLPAPHSADPTQWLFDGRPSSAGHPASAGGPAAGSDALQVAVARLVGYRWPRQTGAQIPGCHLLPDDGLGAWADAEGIVCLPPVAGQLGAEERLRGLLMAAFPFPGPADDGGGARRIERLLTDAGFGGKTIGEWLRDGFFTQHLRRFHNRPFVWHIWDGHKDGFSALVNYHGLTRAKLEKLTYTYLGDWINRQIEGVKNKVEGAESRLIEAKKLEAKLEAIVVGEPPYDIYVRWKPLAAQPCGWEPDVNDGVRVNIRPFVEAEVLRVKKPSIHWNKDRGTNPDGSDRVNDRHLTLAQKQAARDAATE